MKKFHKYLGFIMLLPFVAWAITGVFFYFKPGYQDAYQPLLIKLYPIEKLISLPESSQWLEARQLKTIVGDHLLVKTKQGWQHLSPVSLLPIDKPSTEQITMIVNDAINENTDRYGVIESIDKMLITTDTKVRITLNWERMTLRQQGVDTDFINTIYDIHYLRWTGFKALDQILGVVGLLLVVLLAGIGVLMTFNSRRIT
ncbi:MAG: PepSY domain-containing protein [Colwelliaceae bacterium]|nr:PepSY domain-containing protein [Colwelliaceae bacterium]